MTKIKNTKKGMAKKTLSMSLVVAMLATSNVPVWAAEFSDGTDAAVTSEAEAPAVDTADEFSDNAAEAPVVADDTTDVPVAQVAEGYTVNTNMELKSVDWASNLELSKKEGVKDDAKFEILDKNTVAVDPTKVEIYSGDNLWKSVNVAKPVGTETVSDVLNTALSNATTDGLGLDAYKYSKQVTVKVYVGDTSVYEVSATVKPVNIKDWTVTRKLDKGEAENPEYNGKIQSPTVTVTKTGYTNPASVIVKFDDEKDAKNADTYTYYVEGVEADGYVGEAKGSTADNNTFTITPATPTDSNLSVVISGDTTYNGINAAPKVVITDKLTNTVLPTELYDVKVNTDKKDVGSYKNTDLTITLKASAKVGTDTKETKNNFAAVNVASLATGEYKINALDLSKLGESYTITVAARTPKDGVPTWSNLTFVDKSGKTVDDITKVLPTADLEIVASNYNKVGTATLTIRPKNQDTSTKNITGEYTMNYSVVGGVIDPEQVAFPANTKIGTADPLTSKTSLKAAEDKITAVLGDVDKQKAGTVTYTGSALEPLKDAFSNLVLNADLPTVTPKKLVLGTDYDITYTDNTDSYAVSGKVAKVTLTFKGDYTGTIVYKFKINQATAHVDNKDIEYTAGKTSYDAVAEVYTLDSNNKKVAVPEKEYSVTTTKKATLKDKTATGVVVFENKNYVIYDVQANTNKTEDGRWFKNVSSSVVEKDLKKCTATVEGSYVFTGEAVNPKLIVKDGDVVLVEGTDYEVISKTGTNAGVAHVTIKGKGNYIGTLTADYTIAKANLTNATVTSKNKDEKNFDISYSGYPVNVFPLKEVKIGNTTLKVYDPVKKEGDYTVSWDENAVEVGTYNFTISAVASSTKVEGEYKGTFKITAFDLKGAFAKKLDLTPVTGVLDTSVTGAAYTGQAITIDNFKTKYVIVKKDKKGNPTKTVLTEGKDYRLEYTNNVDAGTATVTAYGIGNYAAIDPNTGKAAELAKMQFTIKEKDSIKSDWVKKISDVEYAGGLAVEPEVVIIDEKENRLVQGVDYTVETAVTNVTADADGNGKIDDNERLTNKQVTIKGKGAYVLATNFSIPDSCKWKVTKKDFANTTISVDKDNNVTVMNGTVVVPSSEYDVKFSDDKKKVTVTAKADSKNYTGSKEITIESAKVGQAMIANVVVKGNTVTPVLSSEVEEAVGYDYVIATEEDYKNGRVGVSKNILKTNTDFHYVQQGTYYAYCHAWKRNAEGKKVFGEWSNIVKFTVTATTPSTPTVKSVKVKGSTVTVTYTTSEDATGYDVVLGSAVKKVNGEKRPVDYGTLVKKNIKGNVVTATFKNVPAGKYYAGVHSFNKTSENGSKVFSKWSNSKAVTVK